jgi:hypothetical protein
LILDNRSFKKIERRNQSGALLHYWLLRRYFCHRLTSKNASVYPPTALRMCLSQILPSAKKDPANTPQTKPANKHNLRYTALTSIDIAFAKTKEAT